MKVIMLRDNKYGYSNRMKNLTEEIAKELIEKGYAKEYNTETARRIVNLNGKEITWSEYMKYKKVK